MPGHGGKPRTFARTTSRISYDCSFSWDFAPFLLIFVVGGRVEEGRERGRTEDRAGLGGAGEELVVDSKG